ncbi:MAG: N-acetylmuramoyl-L-alanine amidase [Ignavibacteria bacterium]|nr:N-acetylmuramoyl-L-alanine amidase [Ignavibacteria bacterium]
MKIIIYKLWFLMIYAGFLLAQKPVINLVFPDQDTTFTDYKNYRIAGNTNPDYTITVNDENLRVYETGAFATLLKIKQGTNKFTIRAYYDGYLKAEKDIYLVKEEKKLKEYGDIVKIFPESVLPAEDRWISAGESLTLSFSGTTGCSAIIPGIIELPFSDSKKRPGYYSIKINANDFKTDYFGNYEIVLTDKYGNETRYNSSVKMNITSHKIFFKGKTKGFRPLFSYELQTDRLGLKEPNYISEGTELTVTGKKGKYYRFSISGKENGWIPEEYVTDFLANPEFSFVSSEPKYKYEYADTIKIKINTPTPYITYQRIDPAVIVVKLVGYDFSGYEIINKSDEKADISHFYNSKEKTLEVFLTLDEKQVWGYSVEFSDSILSIIYKRKGIKLINDCTVILDAGHGGNNLGALGSSGALEKDVNYELVSKIKKSLVNHGAKVILLRDGDENLSNPEKIKKVFETGGDILLSIHCNSVALNVDPHRVRGTAVYYHHSSNRQLAEFIHKKMIELGFNSFGIFEGFNLSVNSVTELPAVLIETAFLSNPYDEVKLLNPVYQEKIADKITEGIIDFLKWSNSEIK